MSTPLQTGAGQTLRRDILTTLLPGFVGPVAPEWLLRRLEEGLGGVCLFGTNVHDAAQLRALNDSLRAVNPGVVIAIDEEGGDVTRLFYDVGAPYPGNAILGRLDDLTVTEGVARAVGEALAAAGCTLTFAPDADVNSDPNNPVIGVRSFGSDPELVARHTAAWVRGIQSTGVAASAKHFPGHGDTATDSHLALPVVDLDLDALRARELVPFRAAVAAGTATIMTSHILLPQLDAEDPATLSPHILHSLLRGELGFEGVIVTDALDMKGASGVHGIPEAAVRALAAGCDLLCIGSDNSDSQIEEILVAVETAVAAGRVSADRIAEAAARVRALESIATELTTAAQETAAHMPTAAELLPAFEIAAPALGTLAGGVGTVVRIETVANIAIGEAPWGVFAAEAEAETPGWVSAAHREQLSVEASDLDVTALPGPVVVVGKDVHRHGFARRAVDALRAAREDVVVIDMGWPSDDRGYADIATFGASRLVGEAVIALVNGAGRIAPASLA